MKGLISGNFVRVDDVLGFIRNEPISLDTEEDREYMCERLSRELRIEDVVCCKDCMHRRKDDGWCSVFQGVIIDGNFYCADGEILRNGVFNIT